MKLKAALSLLILVVSLQRAGPANASNEQLSLFLQTSAYGAAIGAGAGVVSLAFSDQPSKNLNQIARGASLGLYAGMAVGAYLLNANPKSTSSPPPFALIPTNDGALALWSFQLR